MPYNGSGTYSLPTGNPVQTGTVISSSWANTTLEDIATALSDVVTADGQTTPTANIKMGGFRLIGLGDGVNPTDAVTMEQVPTFQRGFAGACLNAFMSVPAASATGSFTADEVVVETALAAQSFHIGAFSQGINLITTGAGGMDTGSAPASSFVAIYAIYNPTTNTSALLGVDASGTVIQPPVYGGAHMPTGYTASGLISIWPTDSSRRLSVGVQRGRKIAFPPFLIVTTSTPQNSPFFMGLGVPYNAIECTGFCFMSASVNNAMTAQFQADVAGTGANQIVNNGSTPFISMTFDCPILTPQGLYRINSVTGGPTVTYQIYNTSYII